MDESVMTYEEILERMDYMLDEVAKLKRAVIAAQNGESFTESFSDDIFMEDADKRLTASSKLARLMQHLLKAKYSIYCREEWKDEAEGKFRDQVWDNTNWGSKKRYTNVINYIEEHLQDIYEEAIKMYKVAANAKKYHDLIPGIKFIPEECPWETLKELMEDGVEDLLEKLPDPEY